MKKEKKDPGQEVGESQGFPTIPLFHLFVEQAGFSIVKTADRSAERVVIQKDASHA